MSNHKQIVEKHSPPTQLFINNEWVNASDGSTFPLVDPSTEDVLLNIAHAKKADVDDAVQAARNAFNSVWATFDPTQRGALMFKLADLMEQNKQTLGELEAINNGKCLSAARDYDIAQAIQVFRYYAGWCDKLPLGELVPSDKDFQVLVRREAVGVVGAIVPWNFPLMLTSWKVAPALAVGCTVVLKPSEVTPLTGLFLAKLAKEAGFPAGVLNVVPGFGATAGEAITSHMDIDKVSFTGSTEVGRRVMVSAAQSNLKKVSLELGGKSPNVFFDDCDFDDAVAGATQALYLNMGQNCCSGSRCYVQDTIYDKFVAALAKRVQDIHIGNPLEDSTNKAAADGKIVHGPVVNKAQFTKVLSYIDKGNAEGAKLTCGGKRHGNKGYFIEPTLFSDVTDGMTIAREEIFGPVLVVLKFSTLEDAIAKANGSNFGLASAVWTKDLKKIAEFTAKVKCGVMWHNTYNIVKYNAPFGGVKSTGFGRDLGKDALFEYMSTKTVCSKL